MTRHVRAALLTTLLSAFALVATAAPAANLFFAFDNGVGREARWSPVQQAQTLARIGYDGIGYTGVEDLAARHAAFDAVGLRIVSVYVPCFVDRTETYSPALLAALPRLAASNTIIWLTVQGRAADDTRAVRIINEIAEAAAQHGVRVALYPHKGFFVATAEDALRLVNQSDRTNLGVSFNLAHELAAGNADRIEAILRMCGGKLMLVSVNGADHTGDWSQLIRPLDEGDFDVRRVLGTLDALGYRGPIGLQCYAIKGDPETLLRRSIAAWKSLTARRSVSP